MGFLDSINEEDLDNLSNPIFDDGEKLEVVVGVIREVNGKHPEKGEWTALSLTVKVLSEKHQGTKTNLFIPDYVKAMYVPLCISLYGEEAVKTKTANLSDAIGKKLGLRAGKATTIGDAKRQAFFGYEDLGRVKLTKPTPQDAEATVF